MKPEQIHYFMRPLIVLNIFIIMGAEFLAPLWSKFAESIGGTVQSAGIAISIFSIVIGIFIMIAGRIEHHYRNEETMVMITAILMSLGYCGYFFVRNTMHLYLLEGYLGLATAFQSPAMYSLYNRYMPKSHSAFHWGMWNGFYFVSFGVAALTSGFIAHHYDFKAVFSGMVVLSLISLSLILWLMPQIRRFTFQNEVGTTP